MFNCWSIYHPRHVNQPHRSQFAHGRRHHRCGIVWNHSHIRICPFRDPVLSIQHHHLKVSDKGALLVGFVE